MLQDQRKRPHIQIRDQSLECGKNLSDTKIRKQEKDWRGCVINTFWYYRSRWMILKSDHFLSWKRSTLEKNINLFSLFLVGGAGHLERHEEPENRVIENIYWKIPDHVVDDLNATEDGEASEKTHCASNQAQLSLQCHLLNHCFYNSDIVSEHD